MSRPSVDLFLTFLSEKGEGRWDELKDAWSWLAGAAGEPDAQAWIAARDLEALGHIEVGWEQGMAWCAAPPLLTMIPRSGGRVFLTGARTRHLELRLEEAASELDLWVDSCEARSGPRSIFVACNSAQQIREFGAALEVGYTYQVADQIAALLPPLDDYVTLGKEGELPRGPEVEIFDVSGVCWQPTETRDAAGLYRCRTYSGQLHGLHLPTGHWTRVLKEIGIYEVLRWAEKNVLQYSEDAQRLTVSSEARLPALHARAFTLCSGRLPSFSLQPTRSPVQVTHSAVGRTGGRHGRLRSIAAPPRPARHGTLTYENVPATVAERVAASLRQQLVEAA